MSAPIPTDEQPPRVVPLDELRADDAGVRPEGLLDELANRGGLERHVVVEEAEEPRALDELQRLVRGRAEPRVGVEPADVGRREAGRRPLAARFASLVAASMTSTERFG